MISLPVYTALEQNPPRQPTPLRATTKGPVQRSAPTPAAGKPDRQFAAATFQFDGAFGKLLWPPADQFHECWWGGGDVSEAAAIRLKRTRARERLGYAALQTGTD